MKIHARIETARAAYVVSESFQARGKNIWGDWVTLRIVRMPAGAVYEHTQSPGVSVLRAETVDARFQGPRAGYTKALTEMKASLEGIAAEHEAQLDTIQATRGAFVPLQQNRFRRGPRSTGMSI